MAVPAAAASYQLGTAPIKPEYIVSRKTKELVDDDVAEGSTNHITAAGVGSSADRIGRGAEGNSAPAEGNEPDARDARDGGGAQRNKRGKGKDDREKKKKGSNKGRRWNKVHDDLNLCWRLAAGRTCEFGEECRFTHDIPAYLSQKPRDIYFPPASSISLEPPYVALPTVTASAAPVDPTTPTSTSTSDIAPPSSAPPLLPAPPPQLQDPTISIDFTTTCPVFQETGECRHGLKCRFLGGHADQITTEDGSASTSIKLKVDEDLKAVTVLSSKELNFSGPENLALLRKKKYPTPQADIYLAELKLAQDILERKVPDPAKVTSAASEAEGTASDMLPESDSAINIEPSPASAALGAPPSEIVHSAVDEAAAMGTEAHVSSAALAPTSASDVAMDVSMDQDSPPVPAPPASASVALSAPPSEVLRSAVDEVAASQDTPDVPMRPAEKKSLHWEGKTYLAPLTTVGNLPFRRLCVDLGADITCGEMGLATSFLSGSKEEWSLVRRHPSEKIFGVQLAGNKPTTLVPTAEVVASVCEDGNGVDFVDLNCGCPIDLVFKTGSGSAMLDAVGRLSKSLVGMSRVLGEIPLTVKLRTGIKNGQNTAHKLMPRMLEWGVAGMTLHGRTRQQRYDRVADWAYIKTCVDAVRAKEADDGTPRIPLFGGGDAFSAQDYWEKVDASGVDGVMLARGALIKPWLFTEVKERREWDISATERLGFIRRYAEYGLSHFGTDTAGVNTTRRYLCEALSFQYRYVPLGILEVLPSRINDRPPVFRGRNELETLLASDDSRDWVKISEMFLGPAPEQWSFLPKHKSNAYESQG